MQTRYTADGVTITLQGDLERHGVSAALGPARIFATMHEALAKVQETAGNPQATRQRS